MQEKVVFIVGPTGVGKTDLAFALGKKCNGDLISADSVQVYRKLDIISGKDIPNEATFSQLPESIYGIRPGYFTHNNIRVFLLDVVDPTFSFSVSHFYNLASKQISQSIRENKIPIVVGGTGLYIKSLIDGLDTVKISPDIKFRQELSRMSVEELQEKLKSLDVDRFERMNDSDRMNSRRLIRAIEIAASPVPAAVNNKSDYHSLVIGLHMDTLVLRDKIDKRVTSRLANGALEEAKILFEIYDTLCQQVKDANGYKQLFAFLKKEISLDEAIYRWKISEYRHAKNQMTWFRKYGNVEWFDIQKDDFLNNIDMKLSKFLL